MSATKLASIAAVLQATLETIDGLKVYDYMLPAMEWGDPISGLSTAGAATISGPNLRRVDLDTPEPQLGSYGWFTEWTVHLYVPGQTDTAQRDARALLGLVVAAIDNNAAIWGSEVQIDMKLASAEHSFAVLANGDQAVLYECAVEMASLVP